MHQNRLSAEILVKYSHFQFPAAILDAILKMTPVRKSDFTRFLICL